MSVIKKERETKEVKPRALLLGMVYANEKIVKPSVGQEYRDKIRCKALEDSGYDVFTLDDKHTSAEGHLNKHCRGNFCDTRRFDKWLADIWAGNASEFDYDKKDIVAPDQWDGKKDFNCIVLDYFFSPDSWAKVRWADSLFVNSIPTWATDGTLSRDSNQPTPTIWLPNILHVDDMIKSNIDLINEYYSIEKVIDPMENPLFAASNCKSAYDALVKCREQITNDTQLPYLLDYSNTPFYKLTLREKPNKKRKLK